MTADKNSMNVEVYMFFLIELNFAKNILLNLLLPSRENV